MQTRKSSLIKNIYKNKFFYPGIVIVGFSVASFVVLYLGSAPSLSQLKEGDISLKTIYAPYDFSYPTDIDVEKTEKTKKELEARIFPVYDIDYSIQENAFTRLDSYFDTAKEMENVEGMRKIAKDALENIFLIGVADQNTKAELTSKNIEKVSVRNTRFKIERDVNAKELVDEKEAKKILLSALERMLPRDRQARQVLYDLISREAVKNLIFNEAETSSRKAKARDKVLPIYNRKTVKKNELIIEKGQRLTKDDIAKLSQITHLYAVVNRTSYLSGLFILLLGLVLVVVVYLILFERKLIQHTKHVLLISINAFLAILLSLVIIQSQLPDYLIPLASTGMILTLLLSPNTAFIVTLALSIYIGFMAGGKLGLVLMLSIGSVLGIYAVHGARRRSQIFFAGFLVSVANFFSILGTGLLNNMQKEAILKEGFYGIANGVISSFIVIGLLPLFEYTFNLITNVTLLELSDLGNPILKELTVKAPGTYHHSILVGNLAEEACAAIGANALLARVGAYYHDIGKIGKAEYFVENEVGSRSKHEKLAPSMSALIITNHTKDGIEMAKKYKLNNAIIDFISQHHGTSLIYYFYQRALEKVKSEEELKEEEFRYEGPKPQTKETAIVHLADSVEASSRMLQNPTPARIEGLVRKIINNRFIDGQLDECELTLKDLHKISESFVRILTGVFHSRLEYPEAKPKKERKNGAKDKDKQSK